MKDTLVCVDTACFERKGSKDGLGPFGPVNLRVVRLWIGYFDLKVQSGLGKVE